jgi:hypothetical protein
MDHMEAAPAGLDLDSLFCFVRRSSVCSSTDCPTADAARAIVVGSMARRRHVLYPWAELAAVTTLYPLWPSGMDMLLRQFVPTTRP